MVVCPPGGDRRTRLGPRSAWELTCQVPVRVSSCFGGDLPRRSTVREVRGLVGHALSRVGHRRKCGWGRSSISAYRRQSGPGRLFPLTPGTRMRVPFFGRSRKKHRPGCFRRPVDYVRSRRVGLSGGWPAIVPARVRRSRPARPGFVVEVVARRPIRGMVESDWGPEQLPSGAPLKW